jgi:hypothetical protein
VGRVGGRYAMGARCLDGRGCVRDVLGVRGDGEWFGAV